MTGLRSRPLAGLERHDPGHVVKPVSPVPGGRRESGAPSPERPGRVQVGVIPSSAAKRSFTHGAGGRGGRFCRKTIPRDAT